MVNPVRVMTVCDGPFAGTGFSEEMRNILFRLAKTREYEVYWENLQHAGHSFDIEDKMFKDLPAVGSKIKILGGVGGGDLGFEAFQKHFNTYKPDIIFNIGDPHHFGNYIDFKREQPFTLLAYTTLDGIPVHPSWKPIFDGVDIPINMSEWAYREFQRSKFKTSGYVHHGVNWNYWTTNRERKAQIKKSLGIDPKTIIFGNWDTNQYRKRDDSLLKAWKNFHPERKNAKLFLNKDSKCRLGIDLEYAIRQYEVPRETIILPEDITTHNGRKFFDVSDEPEIHKRNCEIFDVYVSATGGEGFGRCSLEAMSLGIPVIITDYSACSEVCEKGSILIPYVGRYRLSDSMKLVDMALIDENKLTEAMLTMYNNPSEREETGLEAREWAREFDYDTKIFPAWMDIFSRIEPDAILANNMLRYIK